mmetsp:Transcript_26999/g.62108  ORF Transcript_26999/g.62108 Transcript_26999/m.62108 type:complete len:162 (-) Transcript_26999:92-577(-)
MVEPVRAGELDAFLELLFEAVPATDPSVAAVPNTVTLPSTTTQSRDEAEPCHGEEVEQQAQYQATQENLQVLEEAVTQEQVMEEPVQTDEINTPVELLLELPPAVDPPATAVLDTAHLPSAMTMSTDEGGPCQGEVVEQQARCQTTQENLQVLGEAGGNLI